MFSKNLPIKMIFQIIQNNSQTEKILTWIMMNMILMIKIFLQNFKNIFNKCRIMVKNMDPVIHKVDRVDNIEHFKIL